MTSVNNLKVELGLIFKIKLIENWCDYIFLHIFVML